MQLNKTKLSIKSCESCIFYQEICDDPEKGNPCREYVEDCCGKQMIGVLETDHHYYFACQNPECASITALAMRDEDENPSLIAYG